MGNSCRLQIQRDVLNVWTYYILIDDFDASFDSAESAGDVTHERMSKALPVHRGVWGPPVKLCWAPRGAGRDTCNMIEATCWCTSAVKCAETDAELIGCMHLLSPSCQC